MDAQHVGPVIGLLFTLAWFVACWYRTPPRGW